MVQFLGAILIVSATTFFGISLFYKEKYRLRDLEMLERTVLLMKNQISYLGQPLHEIFETISWKTDGEIGKILELVAKELRERNGASAEEIWERVWTQNMTQTYLSMLDLNELISFGKTLGFLEREQQTNSMDLLLFHLNDAQEEVKKKIDKNGKLYYSMGALSGLLLVIVLI